MILIQIKRAFLHRHKLTTLSYLGKLLYSINKRQQLIIKHVVHNKRSLPMAYLNNATYFGKYCGICLAMLMLAVTSPANAQQVDKVTTFQDEDGWKLQVNGDDFYIKGVVWGYAPPGTNYTYSIWNQPEDLIRKVVDKEFALMKAANINSIRTFGIIPPEWVTYIYEEFGIMTVINPLMGRYGATIDGVWVPSTDYSDPRTRETLKANVLQVVETYKDVPGVLMFALGN